MEKIEVSVKKNYSVGAGNVITVNYLICIGHGPYSSIMCSEEEMRELKEKINKLI